MVPGVGVETREPPKTFNLLIPHIHRNNKSHGFTPSVYKNCTCDRRLHPKTNRNYLLVPWYCPSQTQSSFRNSICITNLDWPIPVHRNKRMFLQPCSLVRLLHE